MRRSNFFTLSPAECRVRGKASVEDRESDDVLADGAILGAVVDNEVWLINGMMIRK
jgi:hypothetical protein